MDNKIILFGRNSREGWEDEEKHSYDANVLEKEYEERLYSVEGRKLLNMPKTGDASPDQNSSNGK